MQHDHDQILFWRTFSNGRAQICAQYSKLFIFAFEWTNHIVKFEYTVLFIEQGKIWEEMTLSVVVRLDFRRFLDRVRTSGW